MGRKLVPDNQKWAAVIRIFEGKSTPNHEARRLSLTPAAIRKWMGQYLKAHPDADKRHSPPPPPPPAPPDPPPQPDLPPAQPAGSPQPAGEEVDQAAVDAAVAADGDITSSQRPATGSPPPPAPTAISISTEAEDMAIVEGAGNQLMGLASRVMIFVFERKAGVTISVTPRIQELFILTPAEKAMLRPASRHLALKLRELIGSDEKVAYTVGGSTILQGLWDRARVVGEAVAAAVERKKSEMPLAAETA